MNDTPGDLLSVKPALEKVDFDERVFVIHKGRVLVASGALEEQIKQMVARMDEQPATA